MSYEDLNIAIVGAGPAGIYSADILLRQLEAEGPQLGLPTSARIDLYEQLPVPFGLVRYGVAPDHPSIKYIADALEKTLDNPHIHLYCDVTVGRDISVQELRERYDAVLFATGAIADRPLLLPGAEAEGVFGAAKFVEWYDGYPSAPRQWDLSARSVAVIGGGNVGMDVARELMRYADDLKATTDISDNVYEGIARNQAQELHMFIRRGVAQAKFSVQELREMQKLPKVQLVVDARDFELDPETVEVAGRDKLTRQMVEELFAVANLSAAMQERGGVDYAGQPAERKYFLHFNANPVEVLTQDGKVSGVRVERTVTSADGVMRGTGEFEEYPVQAVYHAIGYEPARVADVAYDETRTVLANAGGRILSDVTDERSVVEGLYVTGWAKRGPVGLIGSTKSDALEVIEHVLQDLSARRSATAGETAVESAAETPAEQIEALLRERGIRPIDFAGWKRVDAYERAQGALEGREHKKVVDAQMLRALAHGEYAE